MPIYEYMCLECNETFALLQRMNADAGETQCPRCSSREVRKIISSFCCATGTNSGYSSSVPSGGFSGGG